MENSEIRVLVSGAGGFIGSHLVRYLKGLGYWVRGVDIKYPEYFESGADEFLILDMSDLENCLIATENINEVYALAADMGGMGFISQNHSRILYHNTLVSFNTLHAAHINGANRYFYASSACIYPEYLQDRENIPPLKESDAYPAQPQDAYGWEKLMSERLALHYQEEYGMQVRIARFHNVYGSHGTWTGGREKVPAALCRKIAEAKLFSKTSIDIWGDGEQTRSFCYIDDCVQGIYRIMKSGHKEPLNLGRDDMVSINQLADIIMKVAGVQVDKNHIDGPEGVRGRNSDNTLLEKILGWSPSTTLEEGLSKTYRWIEYEVEKALNV